MKIKVGVIICLLLLVTSVYALSDTKILVHTKPFHKISVKILWNDGSKEGRMVDPEKGSFDVTTDANGNITLNYSSSESIIRISAISRPEMTDFLVFPNIPAGKIIYLDLDKEHPVPVIRDIIKEEVKNTSSPSNTVQASVNIVTNMTNITKSPNASQTQIKEEVKEEKQPSEVPVQPSPVTGNAIKSNSTGFKAWVYILVIAFILIGIILFFVLRKKSDPAAPSYSTKKFYNNYQPPTYSKENKELMAAEKRIKQAQDELNKVRERQRLIADTERKIREDQIRLRRLRGEI